MVMLLSPPGVAACVLGCDAFLFYCCCCCCRSFYFSQSMISTLLGKALSFQLYAAKPADLKHPGFCEKKPKKKEDALLHHLQQAPFRYL
jgi:hypothetical protein